MQYKRTKCTNHSTHNTLWNVITGVTDSTNGTQFLALVPGCNNEDYEPQFQVTFR